MTDQEADELLTPEALAVLQTPLPDEPGYQRELEERERKKALAAALEAACQFALLTSWVTPSPYERQTVVRRGGDCNCETLLSDLDAARWLADRVRERAPLIVERFAHLPQSQTWRNWLALLDRMADLAEHVAWWVA